MKKVINNLLYDTETSVLVYTESGTNRKLYRTQNGNFFTLYPTGEMAEKSLEVAMDYLGEKDVEKYIECFGKPEEA